MQTEPLIYLREDQGLLEKFECSRCHLFFLDPGGRNGKHEFLCMNCSDPLTPENEHDGTLAASDLEQSAIEILF